jgi:predicted esterase
LLLFCSAACANKNHTNTGKENSDIDTTIIVKTSEVDSFPPGKIMPHVLCLADANQSYALYVPAKGNIKALPVIYFFDPHGDGSLPVGKYKSLADSFNYILIGSNNSKNGNEYSTSENIWNTLFEDTRQRLKIDKNRIYTCGFSGGGKVATYIGLKYPIVKGVIANGAGLQEITNAGDFNFSFTAITGEGDMNRTDLVAVNNYLDKTHARHRIIFFDGIHEWAPESVMNIAFAGFDFDAMEEKIIPVDNTLISRYNEGSKKRISEFVNKNNLVRAVEECKLSSNMLDGITGEVSWFKEEDSSISKDTAYKRQLEKEQDLEATETKIKEVFMHQFQAGDGNYWMKTIADMKGMAKAKTAEGAMYQRLQAYLSLAFYSISNQLVTAGKNADAAYFVDLYKKADPTNSEAWYLSAILDAREKNVRATKSDLSEAIANGFVDINRMKQQPEFQQLGLEFNLSEFENKIGKR